MRLRTKLFISAAVVWFLTVRFLAWSTQRTDFTKGVPGGVPVPTPSWVVLFTFGTLVPLVLWGLWLGVGLWFRWIRHSPGITSPRSP